MVFLALPKPEPGVFSGAALVLRPPAWGAEHMDHAAGDHAHAGCKQDRRHSWRLGRKELRRYYSYLRSALIGRLGRFGLIRGSFDGVAGRHFRQPLAKRCRAFVA